MRFHVLAVPHTVTSHEYSACAFTQKVLKFCAMMHRRGHEVIHYGHERSKVECSEHVTVMDDATLEKAYGQYDWRSQVFKHDTSDLAHVSFNVRAAQAIESRKRPNDFLLLFWGIGHAAVARSHADLIVVEPGIGSYNKLAAPFSVFESYAVMHHVYAKYDMRPRFMDAVVPNYFDEADFLAPGASVDDFVGAGARSSVMDTIMRLPERRYVVLVARLIPTKGIQLAIEATQAAGLKLVLAGQGRIQDAVAPGFVVPETAPEATNGVTHIGYIEPRERAVLLARAWCCIMPSLYAEPFGGFNVESQMSGLPVVTTDWGAFAETVVHGLTGYRCRTMDHFVWALKNVVSLDRARIRRWAVNTFGFNKVGSMYEEYFSMLASTRGGRGFYASNEGRMGLKWLEKPAV